MGEVCDAFEQAWRRNPSLETRYSLVGYTARVRIAGGRLAQCIGAPFAHLCVPEQRATDLAIDLWDVDETRVMGPTSSGSLSQHWTLEDGTLATSLDNNRVMHRTRNAVVWLDRGAGRMVGWVTDPAALQLYERARPLQILLALCASDRDLHAAHGAFVARDGRGALLVGDSGTGKSTAALCCAEAGFTYLADDWVAIGWARDNTVVGHSLYNSIALEPAQVDRFPWLRAHAIPPTSATDLKSLALLAEVFPGRVGSRANIGAIVLPRLAGDTDSRVRPATKKDALLTMTRSAICSMRPRAGRAAVDAMTRLAQQVPAFWLEVGRDLRQIAPRIDEILATTAA